MKPEIFLELFLCINVLIQAFWLYIFLKDRKTKNTEKLLQEISNYLFSLNNTKSGIPDDKVDIIIDKLETLRINTYNTAKNTYDKNGTTIRNR